MCHGADRVVGLASGCDTFIGQAYGARHYRLVGVLLQRAVLVCCLAACASVALWSQAKAVMLALGE